MLATVNGEIHTIVVEVCRRPGRFIVTILAGGRESCRGMIRIVCLVVIRLVTAVASCRDIIVVAVDMAGIAIERSVRTIQRVKVVIES